MVLLCVDVGSTFTKAALVDGETGELLATAEHRTTIDTDVLDGVDACRASLLADYPEASNAEVLACSSAGGGVRIAVIGNEELVTPEAGRRVALSSGGKVVAVLGRSSPASSFDDLATSTRPDVVLLTGGTDDGDEDGILEGARRLVARGGGGGGAAWWRAGGEGERLARAGRGGRQRHGAASGRGDPGGLADCGDRQRG